MLEKEHCLPRRGSKILKQSRAPLWLREVGRRKRVVRENKRGKWLQCLLSGGTLSLLSAEVKANRREEVETQYFS